MPLYTIRGLKSPLPSSRHRALSTYKTGSVSITTYFIWERGDKVLGKIGRNLYGTYVLIKKNAMERDFYQRIDW